MGAQMQYKRLMWLGVLLGAAFAGLGYRLVDLQVLRHDELSAKARENTQHRILLEPRRGDILDVRGDVLATSTFVKTVCADPQLLAGYQTEVARAIAPLLGYEEAALAQRLTPKVTQNDKGQLQTNRYVVVQRKVSIDTWRKVQQVMNDLAIPGLEGRTLTRAEKTFFQGLRQKSVFVEQVDDQLRVYPNQSLAAHVLGYVGMSERELYGERQIETAGVEGIEKTLNSELAGVYGWRATETDRQRREVIDFRNQDVAPRDGANVVLTIDSFIQHQVEEALEEGMEKHSPDSITGIVIRPRTGEVLAMATLPTFNPNRAGDARPDARRNRVITDVVEPGSTFKIVVVSGALNDGLVKLTDVFDCEHGRFHFAGRTLHDHEAYDGLSVERIITKSSNIGAAKVGIKLGETRLYDYIRAFGFGSRTGIPLPGEMFGIVHSVKNWSKVSIAQIPMGQGISVTRLQMVMAMSAIANGGVMMRPMIVDHLEDRNRQVVAQYSPQRVGQVMSESAAKLMVQALKTVTTSEGTAPKAAMEHYTVAGKTGTAQKVESGVYVRRYVSSFIGFFPADHPEVCISVVLDDPKHGYYGGQAAAPIFKKIAEGVAQYLNIRPEDGSDMPVTAPTPQEKGTLKTAAAR
jgi:cell division protein FtsI/penicillin-binding protein 2